MARVSQEIIEVRSYIPIGNKIEAQFTKLIRKREVNGQTSKAFISKQTANLVPRERRVFIAQVYGEVWVFAQRGTPMMRRGRIAGPWPTISHNVEAKKRWIVLVIDDTGSGPPTRAMLIGAKYFDCSVDRALPEEPDGDDIRKLVIQIEALQEVGRTNLRDGEIQGAVEQLLPHWNVSDSIVWNSQHFSLHLAAIILTNNSFDNYRSLFAALSRDLLVVACNTEGKFLAAKHVGCMAGFVVSGLLTFGAGAFGFWAGAGLSIGRAAYVQESLKAQVQQLREVSERFLGFQWIRK